MRTGFIGIGNMGGAILYGYAASEASDGNDIAVFNRSEGRSLKAKERFPKISICRNSGELSRMSDIIIIGVKPQGIDEVLEEVGSACRGMAADKIIVSMAAGVPIKHIEGFFDDGAKVVRIMPNTPAQVGAGMTSISRNCNVSDGDLEAVKSVLDATGRVEETDESLINCVGSVSGSSPAYTFMYIQALSEAAVENGMTEEKARIFAAQSVLGAAKLALESDESLEQLRINVCSPKGTTIEAVETLLANGFMEDVKEGFRAALRRSIEMTEERDAKK